VAQKTDAYLEDSHPKRVYIGGLRREFRYAVFCESELIRVYDFWCAPSDGIPSVSDLIISFDGRGRLHLIF